MKTTFCFVGMEEKHDHSQKDYERFLCWVQQGVLLGLKDLGLLSQSQYQQPENYLKRDQKKVRRNQELKEL